MKPQILALAIATLAPAFASATAHAMAGSKPGSDQSSDSIRIIRLESAHMDIENAGTFTLEGIAGEISVTLKYSGYTAGSLSWGTREEKRIGRCNVSSNFSENANGFRSNLSNGYMLTSGYAGCVASRIELAECVRNQKRITLRYNETQNWVDGYSCK